MDYTALKTVSSMSRDDFMLAINPVQESPMGARLGKILKIALPVAGVGGVLTSVAGLFYGGRALTQNVALGVTTGLSAIPEGLPLLAGVGQAAVASRLARRQALVRRLAAIEALGRVDVARTDKTGTLTEGKLALRLLATLDLESPFPCPLTPDLRPVLLGAALASPHPEAPNAATHPTDRAVLLAALSSGLEAEVHAPRQKEVPFDSARAFHAARAGGRVWVKGAPERLVPRCTHVRGAAGDRPLEDSGRAFVLARVEELARRGLRMLLVAQGPADASLYNPRGLTVLGFVGISDPLRPSAPAAVRRCQEAGIRVIMLTGDHPATARASAGEAGLLQLSHREVLKAADLADLSPEELDRRLAGVAVIARATPLDKVRIVESLQQRGHVVAMTGDGVNDAPALRLADVGVAMGRTGTEVARQAADVVLADDDFATLVEALVEGRGFWRNMRNGLGLLLGGNIGELGLIVGASVMGLGIPLTPVQILLVNMITDALPSLAVVLQRPQHRRLAGLAREGIRALDSELRFDVVRRAVATAVPSLGAYAWMRLVSDPAAASAAAFPTVILTQLAQTLEVGRVEGMLSRSVVGAVGASVAMLLAAVTVPPLRDFLGLQTPSLQGWTTTGAAAAGAVVLSQAIGGARILGTRRRGRSPVAGLLSWSITPAPA